MSQSQPGKFRKKPVVVEAMQLPADATPSQAHAVYQWVEDNTLGSFEPISRIEGRESWPESGVTIDPRDGRIVIATLEGGHWVNLGDWIIRGVNGEFYPCKPDIFEATYDAVETLDGYLEGAPREPVERVTVPDWEMAGTTLADRERGLQALTGVPQPQDSPGLFEAPHPGCAAPHKYLEFPTNRITTQETK